MDDYYLNEAVYLLEDFLNLTRDPAYGGAVEYGVRGGHGWNPLGPVSLLQAMAQDVRQKSPDAQDVAAWNY